MEAYSDAYSRIPTIWAAKVPQIGVSLGLDGFSLPHTGFDAVAILILPIWEGNKEAEQICKSKQRGTHDSLSRQGQS